jgi:hypothetical protein
MVVIPGEDPEIYDLHVQSFHDEHQPKTPPNPLGGFSASRPWKPI